MILYCNIAHSTEVLWGLWPTFRHTFLGENCLWEGRRHGMDWGEPRHGED